MKKDIFYTAIFIIVSLTIFSLGYFTSNIVKLQKSPISIERLMDDGYDTKDYLNNQGLLGNPEGKVVASINSDKYHYMWCFGANRIKDENKIYFPSATEAQQAGFSLAGNCN